jgi:hypothetical protein
MQDNIFDTSSATDEELDTLFGGEDIPTPPGSSEPIKKENNKSEDKPKDEVDEQKSTVSEAIVEEELDELFVKDDSEDEDEVTQTSSNKKQSKKDVSKQINYKGIIDYLVESGKLSEFEGREDLQEVSEEQYTSILDQQIDYLAENRYKEKINSTGDIGKTIIEYTKNGGNPQEIVNLFKEQRNIQSVDISTEEGQEEVIRAYLEFQGEEESDIDDFIETAKDKGTEYFKKVAEKRHSKLLEINKEQIENTLKEQEFHRKQYEENVQLFNNTLRTTIHKNEDFSQSEKKQLEKFILSHDYQSKDGRKVTGLHAKLVEVNNNPEKLIKLAAFLNDPEKFEKKIENKTKKEEATKTFKFINASQDLKHKKDSASPEVTTSKSLSPFEIKFKN